MGIFRKIAETLSRFDPKPLPEFKSINNINEIPPASILLFYGGTELTEVVGNYVYKHPYKPAAFHAAGYLGDGRVLNIGKEAKILDIREQFRSTRRIDVIVLKDLTTEEREIICKKFERDANNNFYDVAGFIRYGGQLKILKFLKKVRSSNKNDYCSDNVVDNFSEPPLKRPGDSEQTYQSLLLPRKIEVSYNDSENSAPWHLLEHAMDKDFQNGTRDVLTVWKGMDFRT